jgi:hypothetical protein
VNRRAEKPPGDIMRRKGHRGNKNGMAKKSNL